MVCGGSVLIFVWFALYVHSSFSIILTRKRACCFAFIASRVSCYCKCSLVLSHGALYWSAVCDCGSS